MTLIPKPLTPLVQAWLDLWNGDMSRADTVISPDFTMHAAMMDGSDSSAMRGPQALVSWITQTRSIAPDMLFEIEVGPIQQDDLIALNWRVTGHYEGGFPGAAAPVGTLVQFTGTDTLRVQGEQLAEYWVNASMYVMLAQLKVGV
ncbi:ester cyclase [Deinococcus altitudinis]|uniref:ester cyclase n=1 Tax=Deinococcus altitudinis TaxID=468914 RepID=UPI003892BB2D